MITCRFLGNACVEIISEKDHIIIDPVFLSDPIKGIQTVLITHHHNDHIEKGKLKEIKEKFSVENKELEIYGPECVFESFDIDFILIIPGSKLSLNQGDIIVFENNCWKAEGCVAYLISMENKKILHTADSANFSDKLKSIKNQIDLCFTASFPDNFKDYLEFLRVLNPKLVIPYHFSYEKEENAIKLDNFLKEEGINSKFLKIGEEINL